MIEKRKASVAGGQLRIFKKSWNKYWELYLFLIPALAYFIIFHYLPMYGLQIAFRDYNPVSGFWNSPWVGFAHLRRFFNSYAFNRILSNTLIISSLQIVITFPIPIVLAIMLEELVFFRFKKTLQMITYAPHFISVAVLVGMMFNMFSLYTGIVNHFISWLGFEKINFFGEPSWFRPLFIGSGIWQNSGWSSIIYISAISGIDQELFEAAKIDGANKMKRVLHITLPSILPTIVILLTLQFGQIMNISFTKVLLMQNALNVSTSEVISTYVYKVGLRGGDGIQGGQFSFSTAIDLFNSAINIFMLLSANFVAKKLGNTGLF